MLGADKINRRERKSLGGGGYGERHCAVPALCRWPPGRTVGLRPPVTVSPVGSTPWAGGGWEQNRKKTQKETIDQCKLFTRNTNNNGIIPNYTKSESYLGIRLYTLPKLIWSWSAQQTYWSCATICMRLKPPKAFSQRGTTKMSPQHEIGCSYSPWHFVPCSCASCFQSVFLLTCNNVHTLIKT